MSKIYALALVLVTLTFFIMPQSIKASADSWVTKAPMPAGAGGIAVALNGKIYVIGRSSTYVYNPSIETWISKTPMPTPQSGCAIAAYENKIYIFGGYNGTAAKNGVWIATGETQMYDISTGMWSIKAPMPTPRGNLQAEVVNHKIYLISGIGTVDDGYADPDFTNVTEAYDPSNDTWTTLASIPTPVYYYASAVVDNKIYIESGASGMYGFVNLNQIYDPATNAWASGKPLPNPVTKAAAGATVGALAPARLYVVGGTNNGRDGINANQIYDPQMDEWTFGAPMPTSRLGLALAVVSDTLYALGGVTDISPPSHVGAVYTVNEQYFPLGYGEIVPSPSPSPTPSATPSISPSLSPSPSPTLSQTTGPSNSPTPSFLPQPTQSPISASPPDLPIEHIAFAVAIVAITATSVAIIIKKRGSKEKKTP